MSEKPTGDEVPTPDDCPRASGMPMLGMGTWQLTDEEITPDAVETALELGYRHVDTAQSYGNEHLVGDGIERSTVDSEGRSPSSSRTQSGDREDVFLATKIWPDDLDYEDALEAGHEAVENLGVEKVDLLYVHWPAEAYDPVETFRAFDELVEEGITDRIGISNFEPEQIEAAVDHADHGIFAHQFECHPLLQQEVVRETTEEHGIEPVAYSPLARGDVFGHEVLSDIAGDHNVSEAQVSLAWLRERGITAIPKASTEDHLYDNWASLSLQLTEGELADIEALDEHDRKVDPDFAPWNQ